MNPISSGRIGPVDFKPINPASGADGKGAQQAAGQLAGNVAATMAKALNLGVDPDGRHPPFQGGQDAYDVEAAADTLAQQLGATPSERGEIARMLHAFVSEVAATFGAAPDSRALSEIAGIVSSMDDSRDVAGALRSIAQATDRLSRSR